VARDITLAELSGCHVHFRGDTARALDLVRKAKARGVPVSAGVTPAHFMLSDLNSPISARSAAFRRRCAAMPIARR
jgi:dihydroorotase-like cyclic amidohydrolase